MKFSIKSRDPEYAYLLLTRLLKDNLFNFPHPDTFKLIRRHFHENKIQSIHI